MRNQTPARLRLACAPRPIELAPLQAVRVDEDPRSWGEAAEQARAARALTWEVEPVRTSRERYAAVLVVLGLTTAVAGVGALSLGEWTWAGAAGLATAACAWIVSELNAGGPEGGWEFARAVLMGVLRLLVPLLVVVVGLGIPLAAAFFGTEVAALFYYFDMGDWAAEPEVQALLAARTVQFLLIGVLTLLPAMLYFQFDRERVETLLVRWLHHIFRFDPTMRNLDDVDARYGRRIEEAYGTSVTTASASARHRGRSRSPVVLATLLISLGWVLVLVNPEAEFGPVDQLAAANPLFEVSLTPVSFAFLGAYLYSLQVVLRGYVRGDLRPKTYAAVSVRIVLSFVLAWAVQGLLDNGGGSIVINQDLLDAGDDLTDVTGDEFTDTGVDTDVNEMLLGVAFFAGVVPDTVLRYLRDLVAGLWRASRGFMQHGSAHDHDDHNELADRWPLTDLVGIDLYERTRLAEEGITNVQALAHHDVVDLTLGTRIPFERVVHWVDQAVLYEHLRTADRTALRGYGVLTATGLARAAVTERAVLAEVIGEGRLAVLLAALDRADWLPQLLAWRAAATDQRAPVLVFAPPTGGGPPDVADRSRRRRQVTLPDDVPAQPSGQAAPAASGT